MIRVTVVYGIPSDPEAFDRHYRDIHVPLCLRMPDLAGFEFSQGAVSASAGAPGSHMIAVMTYPDADTLARSFASPEGQAAIADVANFASGGASIYTAEINVLR